jgi:hypothetical protein
MPLLPMEELMTTHEIIVSVLRKHFITRKMAEKIADEIAVETARMQKQYTNGIYDSLAKSLKEVK